MAKTSGAYQGLTILALLVGAGLLLFIGIMYTQNQDKLNIVDPQGGLKGIVSKLVISPPAGTNGGSGIQVQDAIGAKQQFGTFVFATDATSQFSAFTSPGGRDDVPMKKPPVNYT